MAQLRHFDCMYCGDYLIDHLAKRKYRCSRGLLSTLSEMFDMVLNRPLCRNFFELGHC